MNALTPRSIPGLVVLLAAALACARPAGGGIGPRSALAEADALYGAALLHARPDRASYDPARAAALLELFTARFPEDRRRGEADDRLALLREVVTLREQLAALKAIDLGRPPRD